jgi:hypothetical protein
VAVGFDDGVGNLKVVEIMLTKTNLTAATAS